MTLGNLIKILTVLIIAIAMFFLLTMNKYTTIDSEKYEKLEMVGVVLLISIIAISPILDFVCEMDFANYIIWG